MAPRIRDRKRNCAVVPCGLGAPRPLVEDREILAENIPIYAALYTLICYLRRRATLVVGQGCIYQKIDIFRRVLPCLSSLQIVTLGRQVNP